jgi:hypothetical protein
MKTFWMSPAGQLSLGLLLVAAVFVAFTVGGDAGQGAISPAIVLALCCAIFGASFIVAVAVLARRG